MCNFVLWQFCPWVCHHYLLTLWYYFWQARHGRHYFPTNTRYIGIFSDMQRYVGIFSEKQKICPHSRHFLTSTRYVGIIMKIFFQKSIFWPYKVNNSKYFLHSEKFFLEIGQKQGWNLLHHLLHDYNSIANSSFQAWKLVELGLLCLIGHHSYQRGN